MIVSHLLAGTPTVLQLVGGVIAAIALIPAAIALSSRRRVSDKAMAFLAFGVALVVVMAWWNPVLELGFGLFGLPADHATTVLESGGLGERLGLLGQIVVITCVAIAVSVFALFALLRTAEKLIEVLRRPSAPQPVSQSPRARVAAEDEGSGEGAERTPV